MGFQRAFSKTSTKQESNSISSKLLVAPLPSMASSHGNRKSTQLVFDQQQQQHQQQQQMQQNHQQFQETHHHHPHQQNNQITFGMMQASSSSNIPSNFLNRDNEALNMADMDPTLFLYMDSQEPPQIQEEREDSVLRPPTLSMFPSQPMHEEPQSSTQVNNGVGSPSTSGSKRPRPSMELSNPGNNHVFSVPGTSKTSNRNGLTSSSEHESPKTQDPKTLRRLAQNREAARKSRLRKKAYIQQLESSRIRLTQLEQEIQRARAQGFYFGGSDQGLPVARGNISSDAAVFDLEYGRWLDDHIRLMHDLRTAVQEHAPENQLAIFVENCLSHYDQVVNLKSMMAKSDAFHLVSGMWRTPAERWFMWMGGFRPTELIKIILNQIQPLTDQQLLGICAIQQSTQENEEDINRRLEILNQFVSETIAADALSSPLNMANHMSQMVMAVNRLSSVEGLIRQADHLRRTTLHRLHQTLTTRQTARCLLAVFEYFHRLRAISSLWLARPRQE